MLNTMETRPAPVTCPCFTRFGWTRMGRERATRAGDRAVAGNVSGAARFFP